MNATKAAEPSFTELLAMIVLLGCTAGLVFETYLRVRSGWGVKLIGALVGRGFVSLLG